jgi:glutamate dehydrogenase (NAD(P)+)
MAKVEKDKIPHRTAAMAIGVEKLWQAKRTRGLFP